MKLAAFAFAVIAILTAFYFIGVSAAGLEPKIVVTDSLITVSNVAKNAVGSCTEFQSLDELLDGKPYTPRHCFAFEGPTATYTDDWSYIPTGHSYDVTVEVTYENVKTGELYAVRSNTVRAKH
jgi:hypothetical protein